MAQKRDQTYKYNKKTSSSKDEEAQCLTSSFKTLLVLELQLLHVDGLVHHLALLHGRFLKSLAGAELADDTRLLEFAFEFLQRTLDVLTFFDLYDNHLLTPPFS